MITLNKNITGVYVVHLGHPRPQQGTYYPQAYIDAVGQAKVFIGFMT